MQTLDDVSLPHEFYPISGEHLEMTGMEPWVAYMFYYMRNIWQNSQSLSLPEHVRQKFQNTWLCLSAKHVGLCRALVEADFIFENVVELDWAQEFAKIGTEDGAWE